MRLLKRSFILASFLFFLAILHCYAQEPWAYDDRGDPSGWDFSSFTCDNNWHTLDVSGVVTPTFTIALHLYIEGECSWGKFFTVRQWGNSNDYNACTMWGNASAAIYNNGMDCLVSYTDPYLDYKCSVGCSDCHIAIRGFYRRGWCGYDFGCPINPITTTTMLQLEQIAPVENYIWHHVDELSLGLLPAHASTHQDTGSDELYVGGLSGILTDTQDAGWFQGLAITVTGVSDGQVLAWDNATSQWKPATVSGTGGGTFTMPGYITATISGTVPVIISDTWHYTEALSSGHDIAVMRSFTYGEASIAISLFVVAVLLGMHLMLSLQRR